MINTIRNTVLSIVSKDNRGYITPEEFNLFARQAQLELHGQYMYDYSMAVAKQNGRLHGSGYADIPELLHEVLDRFLITDVLVYDATPDKFYMPGDNPSNPNEPKAYKVIELLYNNTTPIEKVPPHKVRYLLNSSLIAPTTEYPAYVLDEHGTEGDTGIQVYPTTIVSNVTMTYIRYPRDPKWTYQTLSGGEPLFNPSQADYQDFELPISDSPRLVTLICKYAGVSIREAEVVQLMQGDEATDIQQKA
jgi:hypothetical protein